MCGRANMVRTGVMGRAEGYEKIYGAQSKGLIIEAKKRLGIGEDDGPCC